MSKGVYVRVVHDLELLYSSLCDRTTALISPLGLTKYIVIATVNVSAKITPDTSRTKLGQLSSWLVQHVLFPCCVHACVRALSRSPDQPVAVCREDQRPRAHAGNATREKERAERERERERELSDWARLVLRLLRVAGIKCDVQRGQVTVPFPFPDPEPDLTLSGRAGRPPQLTEQASLIMHGTYTTVKRGQGTTNLTGPQI